jgi:hypothetical protein
MMVQDRAQWLVLLKKGKYFTRLATTSFQRRVLLRGFKVSEGGTDIGV